MATPSQRLSASPLRLLRSTAGTPSEIREKLGRLREGLRAYSQGDALDARLERLVHLGLIERAPTRLQLVVGSVDMLRFWINPAAADYYRQQGIHYGFHQLLRILEEPASMIDPTGFLSSRDTIIGHVMQVVHANPAYDLQLLEAHEGGLDALEHQLGQMLDGSHPKAEAIGAIVEEPDYHARLLAYVRSYRESKTAQAPIRDNIAADPDFCVIEQTFGTLPCAMAYFARMPDTPLGALQHVLTQRVFPRHLDELGGNAEPSERPSTPGLVPPLLE